MTVPVDAPWYQDGLRFECTQCGDRFELWGNSVTGEGGWTRVEAA